MTDNRTTELREKLTERGVEFTTDDFDHLLTTNWWADEIYAKYLEGTGKSYVDEDDPILKLRIKRVTPEQAIAATLGNDTKPCYATDYTHGRCKYSVNRGWTEDTKFYVPTLRHGTLTAEQVREAWTGNLKRDCLYDPPMPDWQAIADELNAGRR